ncbi:MAG: TIR domain-containing protein [Candidatus Kariarchaeaceae archaeon]|jgi:hypothetical protein
MLDDDDFDDLFDSFKERKKTQKVKPKSKPVTSSIEELPIWKEVKNASSYTVCNVCRQEIDDEDIVEACKHCNRYFHFRHLREWLKIKGSCPTCRQVPGDQPIETTTEVIDPSSSVDGQAVETTSVEATIEIIDTSSAIEETEDSQTVTPSSSDIFISFSSSNVAIAEKIYHALMEVGKSAWISTKSIGVGQDYGLQIVKSIDNCKFFILLITNESITSRHVKTELERAFSKGATNESKIPLDWEYYLGSSQWLNVWSQDEKDWLPQVIKAVSPETATSSTIRNESDE